MIWKSCLLGLVTSAAAFNASAQSPPERVMISEPVQGFAYYNRPGATLEQHDAEFRDCLAATNVRPNNSAPTPSIATQLIWGGVIQAIGTSAIENCMIARGWRVFQLPEAEGRAATSRRSTFDVVVRHYNGELPGYPPSANRCPPPASQIRNNLGVR